MRRDGDRMFRLRTRKINGQFETDPAYFAEMEISIAGARNCFAGLPMQLPWSLVDTLLVEKRWFLRMTAFFASKCGFHKFSSHDLHAYFDHYVKSHVTDKVCRIRIKRGIRLNTLLSCNIRQAVEFDTFTCRKVNICIFKHNISLLL